MDLLDFEAQSLYFDEPEVAGVNELIATAAESYAEGAAELPLLRAYFLAPQSLNVLVALNRFYYYQHRLDEALLVTGRALAVIRALVAFPENWQELQMTHLSGTSPELLTQVRLYLFTLKAIGFLYMRLEQLEISQAIFEKLVSLDSQNRIGAQGLLELVMQRKSEITGV